MRRSREQTRESAEMNASISQQWPVANVVLAQYTGEIAEVGILDNAGNWFDAYLGAKDVNYGNSVGVRARGRNTSPVKAFCSITAYFYRPDGSKVIGAMWSGSLSAGALTGYSTVTEKANQVGLYNSTIIMVISA